MKKPKTYRIDSFDKLLNTANHENVERMVVDLSLWLMNYAQIMKNTREYYPDQTKGKKNTEITKCAFVWTDDGKNVITGFEIENPDTGEVTKIKA